MRGIDTVKFCRSGNDAFGGIKKCLGQEACAASGGGCTSSFLIIRSTESNRF